MTPKQVLTVLSIGIILVLVSGCIDIYSHEQPEKIYIISLDAGNEVSGSFILGGGQIGTDSFYYYYQKNADNSYVLKKAETDRSKIFMDTNGGINGDFGESPYVLVYPGKWYEFHVPSKTIIQRFNANVGST